jgi:hypothetical protein
VLDTGVLTDHVLDTFEAQVTDVLVGDGIAPEAGGWSKGQPDVDVFVPYAVLAFGGAAPRVSQEMTLGKATETWLASYQVRYHGGSRAQVDWTATKIRAAVESLLKSSFGVEGSVVWIQWQSLGGVSRNDAVNPPIWTASDNFTLHCTKS